jgi:ATP-dependent RNA helicase DDX10/DBP4
MFERKNQNVLSSHYKNVVEHDGSDFNSNSGSGSEDGLAASSDEEDFITLARADHELPGEPGAHEEELNSGPSKSKTSESKKKAASRNPLQGILPASASAVLAKGTTIDADSQLSNRALKMGASKKAMLKHKGAPHKLTFDEDGDVHEVYDIQAVDSSIDKEAWKAKGREYVEELQDKLQADDLRDREEARDRRREKKRIRKEKEKLVRGVATSSDEDDSQTTMSGSRWRWRSGGSFGVCWSRYGGRWLCITGVRSSSCERK